MRRDEGKRGLKMMLNVVSEHQVLGEDIGGGRVPKLPMLETKSRSGERDTQEGQNRENSTKARLYNG